MSSHRLINRRGSIAEGLPQHFFLSVHQQHGASCVSQLSEQFEQIRYHKLMINRGNALQTCPLPSST